MSPADLPAVNAGLNSLSALLLGLGYFYIRRGDQATHRRCMIGAFIVSALFLISYLAYHTYVAYHLGRGPTVFREPAWFRPIYLGILLTHTVLAMVVVPLALVTLFRGLKGKFDRHKRIARWTWPIWMYVSVTGVLIYLLLYQIFPQR
jgi:uncharacterized membrane protein YozB (DUF420 family)